MSQGFKTLLSDGLRAHRSGVLARAEALYRQALLINPKHADALHLLGVVLLQRGQAAEAIAPLTAAIDQAPRVADFWHSRASAQRALGEFKAAAHDFRRALSIKPDYEAAQIGLGQTLAELAQYQEAVALLREVASRHPTAAAQIALGVAHLGAGATSAAVRALRKAIQLAPDQPDAHYHLGNALRQDGKYEEAARSYRRAIELDPMAIGAWNNLGMALKAFGQTELAIAALREGITVIGEDDKRTAMLWNSLGNALAAHGDAKAALNAHRRAVVLEPGSALYNRNLAVAYFDADQGAMAMTAVARALELDPRLRDHPDLYEILLLIGLNEPEGAKGCLAMAREWNARHAKPFTAAAVAHTNSREKTRRLRVGYVSPDFRYHSVAYFSEPIFRAHDRDQFELFGYAEIAKRDETTQRFERLADHWRETTGRNDDDVAAMIRDDQIDILVDLAGHTKGSRLLVFARKPAPVQATWIGFPATTGLDAMDWRLTDAVADPPGMTESFYSERLWRLPHGFLCYAPPDAPVVAPPPAARNGFTTFGSFNNASKIRDPLLGLWARLLRQTPGARLLIKARALADPIFRKELRERFAAMGGDLGVLDLHEPDAARAAHLAHYAEIDIALDTAPYNGTTTTCEALWMGVPVITLVGASHVARVGASLLAQLGLSEFCAESPDAYIECAKSLAASGDRLATLRASLRERMAASPLLDSKAFIRDVEEAYRAMWCEYCDRGAGAV